MMGFAPEPGEYGGKPVPQEEPWVVGQFLNHDMQGGQPMSEEFSDFTEDGVSPVLLVDGLQRLRVGAWAGVEAPRPMSREALVEKVASVLRRGLPYIGSDQDLVVDENARSILNAIFPGEFA